MVIHCQRTPLNDDLEPPSHQSEGAAGLDLQSMVTLTLSPKSKAMIPTGWCVAIPPGYVGLIRDRSSWALKRDLTTRAGVIDADYRGEIHVLLRNEGPVSQTISRGDRIAQMVITRAYQVTLEEALELPPTTRGEGGFGSTG